MNQAFGSFSLEDSKSPVQQGCQFAGERSGNRIRMPVLWVKINACLCSIRDHEPQLRVVGKCQKAFILQISVDRGTDTADQPHFIYYLSVLKATGDHMIQEIGRASCRESMQNSAG